MVNRASNLRMGPRLHRKERQRVGFEDGLLLLVRQRQGQELIDVLAKIFYPGTWPGGSPEYAVHDLRQAGKVLQQFGGGEARGTEPGLPMTAEEEGRFLPVYRPGAPPPPRRQSR